MNRITHTPSHVLITLESDEYTGRFKLPWPLRALARLGQITGTLENTAERCTEILSRPLTVSLMTGRRVSCYVAGMLLSAGTTARHKIKQLRQDASITGPLLPFTIKKINSQSLADRRPDTVQFELPCLLHTLARLEKITGALESTAGNLRDKAERCTDILSRPLTASLMAGRRLSCSAAGMLLSAGATACHKIKQLRQAAGMESPLFPPMRKKTDYIIPAGGPDAGQLELPWPLHTLVILKQIKNKLENTAGNLRDKTERCTDLPG